MRSVVVPEPSKRLAAVPSINPFVNVDVETALIAVVDAYVKNDVPDAVIDVDDAYGVVTACVVGAVASADPV